MKFKLIAYILSLFLFIGGAGVGTYMLLTDDGSPINNNVAFNIETETAFCEVTGKVYVGQKALDEKKAHSTYSASYTEQDYYSGVAPSFDSWGLGTINFSNGSVGMDNEIDIICFEISIKNLNNTSDNNNVALGVSLSDIAIHEEVVNNEKINYFYTRLYGEGIYNFFSNDPSIIIKAGTVQGNKLAIDVPKQIKEGESLTIYIAFIKNTRTSSFEFKNNIKINIRGLME